MASSFTTSTMYLTSPYPPPPVFPDKNIEDVLFNFPGQDAYPDYTLHIDALTGRRRSKKEFNERVLDAATANDKNVNISK